MENPKAAEQIISSIWEQLIHAPSHVLLLLVLVIVGILIKKSPLPNWTIPIVLISIGAVVYPWLASPTNVDPSYPEPVFVLRIFGGMLGVGSIVAHRFLRRTKWFQFFEASIVNAFRDEDAKVEPPANIDPQKPAV